MRSELRASTGANRKGREEKTAENAEELKFARGSKLVANYAFVVAAASGFGGGGGAGRS